MQPMKQFGFATASMLCWLIWLAPTQMPMSFLAELKKELGRVRPQTALVLGLFHPTCKTFLCPKLIQFLFMQYFSLSKSVWWLFPPAYVCLLLVWCYMQIWEHHSLLSSRSLLRIMNIIWHWIGCWGNPLMSRC